MPLMSPSCFNSFINGYIYVVIVGFSLLNQKPANSMFSLLNLYKECVGSCLATKVYIGKLLATRRG
jgi:hypothetical protein